MAALIIEVAAGARHDTQFHRVERFPYSIGRAYDNDLILADETVSPHHLIIESDEDGQYLRNISTENGTWSGARQLGSEREKITSPQSLSLGRAHLKVLTSDTAIVPTRHFPHASWLSQWGADLRVALGLLGLYLMLSVYFAFERQSAWLNWQGVVINQLFEIVLPLVVATVVGFISRILLHRWQFPLQLSIACIALGILTFSGEVFSAINYWLTSDKTANYLSTIFLSVSFVGLLAWQLRAVSTLSRKRAGWTSVAIIVPVFLVWELQSVINRPDFLVRPPMHTVLRAGDHRLSTSLDSISDIRTIIQQELAEGIAKELDRSDLEAAVSTPINAPVNSGLSEVVLKSQ